MAYKYLNDNGLKAYTKKVKGALKDLHTPIAISTENTTESKAQNVRNIADFVAKAKAAGITDVNGMAVTCLIDDEYSGVGYFYYSTSICGIITYEDVSNPYNFAVIDGEYREQEIVIKGSSDQITSLMLTRGARKPIILTPETTEVDEETYQKLFPNGITTNDVDVMFRIGEYDYGLFLPLESSSIQDGEGYNELGFVGISYGYNLQGTFFHGYYVKIDTGTPHQCNVTELPNKSLNDILSDAGYLNKSTLSPVLKEIDLTGTDAERKAKLDQFEADWKSLTGASNMIGARFVGNVSVATSGGDSTLVILNRDADGSYSGLSMTDTIDSAIKKIIISPSTGSITIIPLFSHLEPVSISTLGFNKMNLDNLNAYKSNLEKLGVDTSKTFQVPFTADGNNRVGNLQYVDGLNKYIGVSYESRTDKVFHSEVDATGKYTETLIALDKDVQVVNTPVPLTATTSTNKTQLDLFLSKVPNAQVMHCTYKDVYAGTLHKINGSWYGILVGESNTIAGQLSIKLQADGTIVEGTA